MEQIRMEEDNMERQQDQQQQQRARGPQNERPPPPAQRCPRCNSSETRFGYYNNYNINQPRYFCKSCKRHWTQGGVLKKVPIGISCRKNKRPVIASSSSGGDVATTTHSFPTVLSPPLNAGVTSSPSSGILGPVILPTGSSFYSGGTFLSQIPMQTLPDRINQSAVIGDGGGKFDANMAHFQEMSLPPLPPQMPHQFQPPINYFSTHESMTLPRPVASWSQSLINNTISNSTSTTNLLSNGDGSSNVDGVDHAGFSFNPIHQWSMWSDEYPGFGPPQL